MPEQQREYWQLGPNQAYEIVDWLHRYEVNAKGDPVQMGEDNPNLRVAPLLFIKWGHNEAANALYGLCWGPGYRSLLDTSKKLEVYAGLAMGWFGKFLEIAGAKMRDYRGWVTDDSNKPMDSARLAEMLGVSQAEIEMALKVLCHENVDWLTVRDYQTQKKPKKAAVKRKKAKPAAPPEIPGRVQKPATNPPDVSRRVIITETELTERKLKEDKPEPELMPEQSEPAVSSGQLGSVGSIRSPASGSGDRGSGFGRSGGSEDRQFGKIGGSEGGGADRGGKAPLDFEFPAITEGRLLHWNNLLSQRNLLTTNPDFIKEELAVEPAARKGEAIGLVKTWMNWLFKSELSASNQQARRDQGLFFGVDGAPGMIQRIYEAGGVTAIVKAIKIVQTAKTKTNCHSSPLRTPLAYVNQQFQLLIGKPTKPP